MLAMRVQVNGEPRELAEGLTVRELLDQLGIGVGPVAVERNGQVLRRSERPCTVIVAGDVLEIVHFAGGG
jgi:thiamine biosynthesis protein ThiS